MNPPNNSFCFAPMFNSAMRGHPLGTDGKVLMQHDATGAFHPYMAAFERMYSQGDGTVTTLKFDNHAKAAVEFQAISHAMAAAPAQLDAIVYFGHGWPTGLVSADIYCDQIPDFASLIRQNCVQGVTIVLYACLCGKVNHPGGCFASRLANALSDVEATVYAHHDAGHTATNPHLYRYCGSGLGKLVAPPDKTKEFNRLLKTECLDHKAKGGSAFWARVPFMDDDEIAAEVG